MKSSDLKVGDRIVQIKPGAGSGMFLKITDIKDGIIGMGGYGCLLSTVHIHHKFVKDDNSLEDITI